METSEYTSYSETSVTTISHKARLDKLVKVLDVIAVLKSEFLVSKVRWTLFCAAVFSVRYSLNLKPLPPYYKLPCGKYNIKELRKLVRAYYRLEDICDYLFKNCVNTIPANIINLLYWVFVVNCDQRLRCIDTKKFLNAIHEMKNDIGNPQYVIEIEDLKFSNKYRWCESRFGTLQFDSTKLYSLIQRNPDQTWRPSNFLVLRNNLVPNLDITDPMLVRCGLARRVTALIEYKNHSKYVSHIDGFEPNDKFTIIYNDKLAKIKYLLFYGDMIAESKKSFLKSLKPFLKKMIIFIGGGTYIYSQICVITKTPNALLPVSVVNAYIKFLKSF
ncbi:uncharacterized protein LOC119662534 [Teleopsis dalmanni]|uniref:uncharacterized protein LOC119662534 n=1 Tax=Teleopsis dalmanni TaxID=139649 RepID=UPI0018CFB8D8|nr:uncharacterized protein LOC119662534 [Teleopsis dalmanni]